MTTGLYAPDGSYRETIGDSVPQVATYAVTGSGYVAYATPTDLFSISGSATKTVRVFSAVLYGQSTAASVVSLTWLKRKTASTGGTPTTPTPTALDSVDPTPTAVFTLYGSAPSLGSLTGNLWIENFLTGTLTASPSAFSSQNTINGAAAMAIIAFNKPITLRGTAESYCLNFNGAALPAGFTSQYFVGWTES